MKSSVELEHEVSRLKSELAAERLCNEELQKEIEQYQLCADTLRTSSYWHELQALKARFIAITSHEFRTPLATIQAIAETLESFNDRLTPQQQAQRFTKIREQIIRMTAVLDDVMILGHLENGSIQAELERFDLPDFLGAIAYEFKQTYPRYILDYLHYGGGLLIQADKTLLQQVVTNLLSNAAKYSHEGSRISLNLVHDAHTVVLTIRDQGIGIPPEEAPYLFEAFHRAKNVGAIEGTGLGLAISKRAVELHGGSIGFSSSLGQGTIFSVMLPLEHSNTGPDEATT